MKKFNLEITDIAMSILDTLVHNEGNPVASLRIAEFYRKELFIKGMLTLNEDGSVSVTRAAKFIIFGYETD